MYINNLKVTSYHYPYKNGKEGKTLESYHNDIEMTITIKPSKED